MTVADIIDLDPVRADHSWKPASLLQLAANPPEPPCIGGLLYPGKRTVLSGETESMKTWLALILAKAEMDVGLSVGWVDLDAMGPGAMLERLRLLGCDDDAISERFLYYQPAESLDPAKIREIAETVADRQIRLLVVDAFNPILNLHNLDPHSTTDVETFWRTICDPISNAGAAPVLLDHVAKNQESRGKYAYGSERKATGAWVHIGFRTIETLARGGRGKSILTVHKDRNGILQRPTLGRLVISAEQSIYQYRIESDKSHDGNTFRPTVLMEKISRWLEKQTEPVSQRDIDDAVKGNHDYRRAGLDILTEEGFLQLAKGARNAKLYTSIRPYREETDGPTDDRAPTAPDRAPNLRSILSDDCAPLRAYKGAEARSKVDFGADNGRSAGAVIHEYPFPPIRLDLEPDPDDLDPGPTRDPLNWT